MSSLSLLFGGSSTQVGEMVFLPSDKPLITNATREFLRSGVIVEGTAYPTFPSWLTQPIGGVLWTQRTLPASADWQSVTYGNGVFVAVARSSTIAATSDLSKAMIGALKYTPNLYLRIK